MNTCRNCAFLEVYTNKDDETQKAYICKRYDKELMTEDLDTEKQCYIPKEE